MSLMYYKCFIKSLVLMFCSLLDKLQYCSDPGETKERTTHQWSHWEAQKLDAATRER